jgi:hypothetical protein
MRLERDQFSMNPIFNITSFPRKRESLFSCPENADARFREHDDLDELDLSRNRSDPDLS